MSTWRNRILTRLSPPSTFTFGNAGAYFIPTNLGLQLSGKYGQSVAAVKLYDENGEEFPSISKGSGNHVSYYILHCSSYYYEEGYDD